MPRNQEGLARLLRREDVSERVVDAFLAVAREDFVPEEARSEAYADRPIAIPKSQTTSQPSLIARMIDVASVDPDDEVLEVGAGYGFQTALLAKLAGSVVGIELHSELADQARANLARAGIENATVLVGDGWKGAPDRGPFDAIIVSAAASTVPDKLREQLKEGGRLVIPVTGAMGDDVYLYSKRGAELVRERLITPARFVPLVREE